MSEPSALALASMPEVVGLAEQPAVLARCASTDKQVSRGGSRLPLAGQRGGPWCRALGHSCWNVCLCVSASRPMVQSTGS